MTTSTTTTNVAALQQLALAANPPPVKSGNFFEALAAAWGQALDKQAQVITDKSTALNQDGNDTPSAMTELSAEAAKMGFMGNASHTAISEAAEALKAVSQK
jgi:hypothetical protein